MDFEPSSPRPLFQARSSFRSRSSQNLYWQGCFPSFWLRKGRALKTGLLGVVFAACVSPFHPGVGPGTLLAKLQGLRQGFQYSLSRHVCPAAALPAHAFAWNCPRWSAGSRSKTFPVIPVWLAWTASTQVLELWSRDQQGLARVLSIIHIAWSS